MNFFSDLRQSREQVDRLHRHVGALRDDMDDLKILAARTLLAQRDSSQPLARLQDAEFKVFSQFGDDGIIQYLVGLLNIEPERQRFVEFGVEDYSEANTRFLLLNNNWTGLIMDGDEENMRKLRGTSLYWQHELTAVGAFITCENINGLLAAHGFQAQLGLLSIDIDGNDYWVWNAIQDVDAAIVVTEYNSVFGGRHAISVPYDPAFERFKAHYSGLYWGASLAALTEVSKRKGYVLAGCNSAGNNAYFVSQDLAASAGLRPLTVAEAFVPSKFRESRGESGALSFLAGAARAGAIADQTVIEVTMNQAVRLGDLFPLET
jgi:hypothetical protein